MVLFSSGKFSLLHHLSNIIFAFLQTPFQIGFASLKGDKMISSNWYWNDDIEDLLQES